jgi:hypothetical protein
MPQLRTNHGVITAMNSRLQWILIGLLSLALMASLFLNVRSQVTASPTQYLYVQSADAGQMTPIEGEHGAFDLTLTGVDPKVIYFADRPMRNTGTMTADRLIDIVFNPLEALPNAVLVVSHSPGADGSVRLPVQLAEPKYDEATSTMRYKAMLLAEFPENVPHANGEEPVDAVPPSFTEASLFIDSDRVGQHSCSKVVRVDPRIESLNLKSASPSVDSWHWDSAPPELMQGSGTGSHTFTYSWDSDSKSQTVSAVYTAWRQGTSGTDYYADITLTMKCKYSLFSKDYLKDSSCTIGGKNPDRFTCNKEAGELLIDPK